MTARERECAYVCMCMCAYMCSCVLVRLGMCSACLRWCPPMCAFCGACSIMMYSAESDRSARLARLTGVHG